MNPLFFLVSLGEKVLPITVTAPSETKIVSVLAATNLIHAVFDPPYTFKSSVKSTCIATVFGISKEGHREINRLKLSIASNSSLAGAPDDKVILLKDLKCLPKFMTGSKTAAEKSECISSFSSSLGFKSKFILLDLVVDTTAPICSRNGRNISLTKREYCLLLALAIREGGVVSRENLNLEVWKDISLTSNALAVAIARLRRKIDMPFSTRLIHTFRGKGGGYSLSALPPNPWDLL